MNITYANRVYFNREDVMGEIGIKVKEFIMQEFLPGEDPDQLSESTPLISGGAGFIGNAQTGVFPGGKFQHKG